MADFSTERASILVLESDSSQRTILLDILTSNGYQVEAYESIEQIQAQLLSPASQVVLCDFDMNQQGDTNLINTIKFQNPEVQVILMCRPGRVDLAVEAIRHGAFDLLQKPIVPDQLILTLARLEEHLRVIQENKQLKEEVDYTFSFAGVISHNQEMKQVYETVKRLSSFNSTVLITGESGTGKELIARAIHNNSLRKKNPFVAINCGAIPENLIESELFGHRKGAFTDAVKDKRGLIEEASTGTLFLDEVGEMPALLQVKLLRTLQEKVIRPIGDEKSTNVDTRIIAATNQSLEDNVKAGSFREDLFYRLNVVAIHLPALRERKEDIVALSEHFILKLSKRLGMQPKNISAAVLAKFSEYNWPGNIRELENCLERALLLSLGDSIELKDLPQDLRNFESQIQSVGNFSSDSLSIKLHSEQLEIRLIKEALIRTQGNRTHAARLLEISHRALLYKLKEYQLSEFLKS